MRGLVARFWTAAALTLAAGSLAGPAHAAPVEEVRAPAANEIDVEEQLGVELEHDLRFLDHDGAPVTIGDYVDGERPVLLTLNYYRCPVLCNIQLNGLTEALARLDWGEERFRIVTVSIDPREGPELAAAKRRAHLEALGRGDDVDWAFLTGEAGPIRLLAAQLGIGYAYDREQDQYAHPPVVVFLSPDGRIVRYVYGLMVEPRDLKFGLMEAARGRIGSPVDKLLLSCFHYDATIGRYGPFAFGIMRLGGALTVVSIAAFLAVLWRRDRQRAQQEKQLGSRAEGAEVLS